MARASPKVKWFNAVRTRQTAVGLAVAWPDNYCSAMNRLHLGRVQANLPLRSVCTVILKQDERIARSNGRRRTC